MRSRPFPSAVAACLLSCAGAQKPAAEPVKAAAPPVEDESRAIGASGEIFFVAVGGTGTSAAFDERRIVGPSVNLTLGDGGTWAGDLAGQNVSLAIAPDRITGAGVDLHVERAGDATSLRGIWFQRRVSLDFTPKSIAGRAGPACSVDLRRQAPGVYQGSVGCVVQQPDRTQQAAVSRATIQLAGDAALPSPPMPQFALALVAVLPP
jgi:hypothetical protein